MKYINPEKSCIVDVNESRATELERSGWTPYSEEQITVPKAKEKQVNKPKSKPANNQAKGKKNGK